MRAPSTLLGMLTSGELGVTLLGILFALGIWGMFLDKRRKKKLADRGIKLADHGFREKDESIIVSVLLGILGVLLLIGFFVGYSVTTSVLKILGCVTLPFFLAAVAPLLLWVATEKLGRTARVAISVVGGIVALPLVVIAWLFLISLFGMLDRIAEYLPIVKR